MHAYSAFNHEGRAVIPFLLESRSLDEGEPKPFPRHEAAETLSMEAARAVREMLVANLQKDFGAAPAFPGVETGGMGGRAYIAHKGTYTRAYHSSFYGFANDTRGHRYTIGVLVIDQALGTVKGTVEIAFGAFLRKNRKFDTIEALKQQIEEDIFHAREELMRAEG